MADAAEIARRAMQLATASLETGSHDLAEMAGSDLDALRDAARLVQERPQASGSPGLSAEHLAFNLITAAHELLRGKPPS